MSADDIKVAMLPPAEDSSSATPDLFSPDRRAEDQPSEGVYVDVGAQELLYVGEIQLPKPIPCELIVEIQGFDYIFKLDRRTKSE